MSKTERFLISNLTDVGLVRESNQDYYGKYRGSFGELIVVCDGMGGYSGGEVASQVAVETIAAHIQGLGAEYNEINELHRSFSLAQQNIAAQAEENPELAEMGTTAVVLLIRGDNYWIAWIGDSRIYRRRGGATEQLSKDHSWVQGMVDQGLIKPEDAKDHPKKNIILRSLGAKPHASEAKGPFPLYRDDVFMLCTDGLSDYFDIKEIDPYLAREPQAACHALVDESKRRGGRDNITIQVLKVIQGPAFKPAAGERRFNLLTLILAFLALALLLASGINFMVLNSKFSPKKTMTTTAVSDSSTYIVKDSTRAGSDADSTMAESAPEQVKKNIGKDGKPSPTMEKPKQGGRPK